MNFVYFDLETERLADEVGGWSNIEQLGLAVAVTLHSRDGQYRVFRQHQSAELLADLREADCVVGFNSVGFDFRVLQPYVDYDLRALPNIDLLLDIKQSAGFRIGLNAACAASFNESKSGNGADSVLWWRNGRQDEVIEYCKQDVLLTRRLHEFGAANGFVNYLDKQGRKRSISVPWRLDAAKAAPAQGSLF